MEQALRGAIASASTYHLPLLALFRVFREHEPHVYVISVVIAPPPDRHSNAKWRKIENYIWVTTSA